MAGVAKRSGFSTGELGEAVGKGRLYPAFAASLLVLVRPWLVRELECASARDQRAHQRIKAVVAGAAPNDCLWVKPQLRGVCERIEQPAAAFCPRGRLVTPNVEAPTDERGRRVDLDVRSAGRTPPRRRCRSSR
jgi:hypothetical protein